MLSPQEEGLQQFLLLRMGFQDLQDFSHPCHAVAAAESLGDTVAVTLHVLQISINPLFPSSWMH